VKEENKNKIERDYGESEGKSEERKRFE